MSMLRNCAVFLKDKRIGLVHTLSINPAQNKVQALIAANGLRGKITIPANDVILIDGNVIRVSRTEKYDRRCDNILASFARDMSGVLVGYVTDCTIDEHTMAIAAIEIRREIWPLGQTDKVWVFRYTVSRSTPDEIIVSTDFSGEPAEE